MEEESIRKDTTKKKRERPPTTRIKAMSGNLPKMTGTIDGLGKWEPKGGSRYEWDVIKANN